MRLVIFGLGFCGRAAAGMASSAGIEVIATVRDPAAAAPPGVRLIAFEAAGAALDSATHILVTAPPHDGNDPVLVRHAAAIGAAPRLAWIGYLSTTGVYGDRAGAWVDEATEPAPTAERSRRRLEVEHAWRAAAAGRPLDIIRLAGIYGPGRSVFDDLRAGRARRVIHPGHAFGRIHVHDIAAGILTAIARPPAGTRILNFADDEPAPSAEVIDEAARLLNLPPPPAIPFAEAYPAMGGMARSFWSENRRVSSRRTQEALGLTWRYPTYREGLRAVLAEESGG
jgi:nucleoside-diphosphate-sugar epimerase